MAGLLLNRMRQLNRSIAILAGLGLLGCAAFVMMDIILRQFGASFGATDEISGYVMALSAAWGKGYTMLEMAHVRIGTFRVRAGSRGRAILDLAAMLTLAGMITLIALQCWPVVQKSIYNLSKANTPR